MLKISSYTKLFTPSNWQNVSVFHLKCFYDWGVESNNWIRDVTFNEDCIKTKASNQSQIMALLRGLAIELIRKTSSQNFQAAIENLTDSVSTLESMLKQVKFL